MLQSIRDHLTGWVAIVLFTIIGLAFAVWGIDYQFTGDNAVAQVNGEEIPLTEIRRAYRNQLNQFQQFYDQLPPGIEDQVRAQVLEGLVRDELLSQHTQKAGYRIGDNALVTSIRNMDAFKDQGQFSMDLFQARLSSQGLSTRYFEEQMRRALRVGQLQQAIAQTAFLTPKEIADRVRLEREQRRAQWARVDAETLGAEIAIDDQAVRAYYDDNTESFMQPERVDVEYVALSLDEISEGRTIDEQALRAYYDSEVAGGRFMAPPERQARHILVAVDDDTDDTSANALALEILEKLRAGEDFAALAAEYSDDPGSAPEGGDLGWAQSDAYVGPFADALFAMEQGDLRGPVRTEFGYHIIRLDGVRGGEAKPFAEVREELRTEMTRGAAEDEFFDLSQRLADLSFENPDSLEPIADELGITVERREGITRAPQAEGLFANPLVIDAAFSESVLELRENSDVLEPTPEQRVVLRASNYHPAEPEPLEAVRERIVSILRAQRGAELAREQGEALRARVRAGEPLVEVAAELNAEYHESASHRRSAGLAPALLKSLFSAPKPGPDKPVIAGLTLADGDYAVYVLEEVVPGDTTSLPPTESVAARIGRSDLAAYIAELRGGADVILRPELLE